MSYLLSARRTPISQTIKLEVSPFVQKCRHSTPTLPILTVYDCQCFGPRGLRKVIGRVTPHNKGELTNNAALISAGQKVEHYEIASYGCLHEWAGLLGNKEAAGLLKEILDQEKAANETLIAIARASGNKEALGEGSEEAQDKACEVKPPNSRRNVRPINSNGKREASLVL
jgi:Domain of unknown function (DUF892)